MAGPSVATSDLVLASANRTLPVRAEAYTQDGLSGMLEIYGRSLEQLARVRVGVSLGPRMAVTRGRSTPRSTSPNPFPAARCGAPGSACRSPASRPGAYVARAHVQDGKDEVATLTRQLDDR